MEGWNMMSMEGQVRGYLCGGHRVGGIGEEGQG